MVNVDKSNPQCPKCNLPCSDAYCCKYCDCNMHWFCGVDGADGSELGHGAHYCCVDCGGRKVSGTSKHNEEVRVGRGTRPRKQQPQRASTTKTPSESNGKHSMKGWKTVGISGKRKSSGGGKAQVQHCVTKKAKNSSKVPSLSATSTADKGNAGKPQRRSQRKPPIVSQAKQRNDSNGDTPVSSNPISDESSAGKHHQRNPRKVSNARKKGKPRQSAKVQEIGNNALSGDLAYNAFSRAINATEAKDASPIAKSLFRHTIQRDINETEDSDGSDGLLKDAHEDELECDSEVEDDEVVDTVICDESFIEHDDDDEDFGSVMDRSILQESWENHDIVEDENPSAERLQGNDYLKDLHCSGGYIFTRLKQSLQ
jgi:hypothetical protein